jgi:hypothetical protein
MIRTHSDPARIASALAKASILATLYGALGIGCASTPEGTPIPAGNPVVAESDEFSIRVETASWHERDRGDEASTDGIALSLQHEDGTSIFARRQIDANATLDQIVGNRRELILKGGAFDYREKRRFLGEEAELTTSLARYRTSGVVILVLTAIRSPIVVELIGTTARGGGSENELMRVLESIHIPERADEAPK